MNKKIKKLEVEGLMNDEEIRWKKIPCSCSTKKDDVANQFPIKSCLHCQFDKQEKSMLQVVENGEFKIGKVTIKKIKIHRGGKFQEIRGWYNLG